MRLHLVHHILLTKMTVRHVTWSHFWSGSCETINTQPDQLPTRVGRQPANQPTKSGAVPKEKQQIGMVSLMRNYFCTCLLLRKKHHVETKYLSKSFNPRITYTRVLATKNHMTCWESTCLALRLAANPPAAEDWTPERETWRRFPRWCFLKWWYPTTMGFPTTNDQHLGVPPF